MYMEKIKKRKNTEFSFIVLNLLQEVNKLKNIIKEKDSKILELKKKIMLLHDMKPYKRKSAVKSCKKEIVKKKLKKSKAK